MTGDRCGCGGRLEPGRDASLGSAEPQDRDSDRDRDRDSHACGSPRHLVSYQSGTRWGDSSGTPIPPGSSVFNLQLGILPAPAFIPQKTLAPARPDKARPAPKGG